MTESHFLLENPSISESSLGIQEKFPRSLGLPIIKYNCVVLFLDKYFGYLVMLPNIFSHRPPL